MEEPEPPNQGKTSNSYFYHILHDPDTHFYCDSNTKTLESLVVWCFYFSWFVHCLTFPLNYKFRRGGIVYHGLIGQYQV